MLSKSKDIALLIEIHNLGDGKNLYNPIIDLLKKFKEIMLFKSKKPLQKEIKLNTKRSICFRMKNLIIIIKLSFNSYTNLLSFEVCKNCINHQKI